MATQKKQNPVLHFVLSILAMAITASFFPASDLPANDDADFPPVVHVDYNRADSLIGMDKRYTDEWYRVALKGTRLTDED